MHLKKIVVATLAMSSMASFAAEPGMKAQAELGFVLTDGNSETQSTNGKFNIERDRNNWRQKFNIEVLSASQNEVSSAERYATAFQTDRKLDDNDFIFGQLTYDDDRFSGFDYESTAAVGYGKTILENDVNLLTAQLGPGIRVSREEGAASESEGIVVTSLNYEYEISDTAKFGQRLDSDFGEDRIISTSITSLTSKIKDALAMKVSLTVKNNSDPALNEDLTRKEETDVETSVALVYSF
ncbi:MAG: DUF481 domain-containing protein [Pseudomonadota bacterium]